MAKSVPRSDALKDELPVLTGDTHVDYRLWLVATILAEIADGAKDEDKTYRAPYAQGETEEAADGKVT